MLFRDIGAVYEARERLKRADVAFSNLAEGVVVTDARSAIVAVNPAFTLITGYGEDEVLGQNPRMLSSGRQDGAFYVAMWETIRATDAWEGEIWNRRKNGEEYPEWLKINAVRGEGGEPLGYVAVFADIGELRANEERLRSLAYHDQLTGLYNRNSFFELFEHALARCKGRGGRVAILYLDLDRFKRINDNFGHPIGDSLLRELAGRIRACLRPEDEAARLGGDELAIVLEAVDRETVPARLARELLERIREPIVLEGRPAYCTASIGIAMYPEDGLDAVSLLKNADSAMYLAS